MDYFSDLTEPELKAALLYQILLYNTYHSCPAYKKLRPERSSTQQYIITKCIDFQPHFLNISPKFHNSPIKKLTSFTKNNKKLIYPPDMYSLLSQWFNDLYFLSLTCGGSKMKNQSKVIHISNIIQFFLDGFIILKHLIQKVLQPLNGSTWVDLRCFIESVEALHPKSSYKNSKNIEIIVSQNFLYALFLFHVFQTHKENELGFEDIETVMGIALVDCPRVIIWSFLKKILQGDCKKMLSLKSFYQVLETTLL